MELRSRIIITGILRHLKGISLVLTAAALMLGAGVLPVQAQAARLSITPIIVRPNAYIYLQVDNMPSDQDFAVLMGPPGSGAVNGWLVAHFNSAQGGSHTYRFEIHRNAAPYNRVDIRIQSSGGYSASASFDNSSRAYLELPPVQQNYSAQPVVPTVMFNGPIRVRVLSVEQGGTVVAELANLPANVDLTVSISPAGLSDDGYVVAHMSTSNQQDGVLVGTFEIPFTLRNAAALDLRLDVAGKVFLTRFVNASS
jgi:hypothetical protein